VKMQRSYSFDWEGLTGDGRVECVANDGPDEYGSLLAASDGFPVCTATVQYPRRGYRATFGWATRALDGQRLAWRTVRSRPLRALRRRAFSVLLVRH